jgi:hypothetical protein
MSAFSRGCLLNARLLSRPAQCSQSSFIAQFVTPRTFSTSQFLNAAKKKTKIPPPPKAVPPKVVPPKAIPSKAAPRKAPANKLASQQDGFFKTVVKETNTIVDRHIDRHGKVNKMAPQQDGWSKEVIKAVDRLSGRSVDRHRKAAAILTPPKALPSKAVPSKAVPQKALPTKVVPPKAIPSKPSPQDPKAVLPIKTPKPPTNDYVPNAYATMLAELPEPTLLYRAPSHTLLRTVSYIGTFFFITYGAYCLYIYFTPPPEAPFWVALSFGTGAAICFAMGGWTSTCPAGIIKTIRAIPKRIVLKERMLGPQAAIKLPELVLEVEVRKTLPLPFMPNRIFYIDPKDMRVPEPLCPNLTPAQVAEMKEFETMMKEEHQKQTEYAATHKISTMVMNFSKWNFKVFQAVRRAWTREGFMLIRFVGLKGGREVSTPFKLDVIGGGFAKDQGKPIDRLCDVKGLR